STSCHDSRTMARGLAITLALIPACLHAQRAGVLKQVDLPHAYYWREMYVPQATSGPSSATWSPDGTELIYSMQGSLWRQRIGSQAATQLTSGPAYDYQPDWSPDGKEIMLVSNRGHIHGTGGLWRMEARPGGAMRDLRYEETTWKARPDWSSDGTRVVYSSYLGRQWNQLWLTTSEGGDPFPLTYGEFDATAPRWSRDGTRIAYIANEGGNTSLWVIEVPGGRKQPVEPTERRYRGAVGTLRVVG